MPLARNMPGCYIPQSESPFDPGHGKPYLIPQHVLSIVFEDGTEIVLSRAHLKDHSLLQSLQCIIYVLQVNLLLLESYQAGTSFISCHLQNMLWPSGVGGRAVVVCVPL